MTKCGAFTAKGHPCKGLVRAGSDRCPAHDPARADARRRSASKAARSKPGMEVRDLKDRLGTLADDVLAGRVEPKAAAVATKIVGAYARLLEFERKVREQEELEARLVALEEGVGKRWYA
jgi:hypothetical protein